jgi:FkbM family methyltransferase
MLKVTDNNIDSFGVKFFLKMLSIKYSIRSGKKLFIDCGSNLGQGFDFFKNYFPLKSFDAILIEPNPHCVSVINEKYGRISGVEIIQKAVWKDDSVLNFFGLVEDDRGKTSTGGSVLDSHNGSMYVANNEKSISVQAFSFSDFLKLKSQEYDVIIVKLDIESAEYDVLEDIIKNGTIKSIDHIFIEFHSQYFHESKQQYYHDLEESIISKIKSLGIGVSLWI